MTTPHRIDRLSEHIVTIEGLFTPDECDALVGLAEGIGFGAAPISTGHGFEMAPEVRNNTRVMLDDLPRAEALWRRLGPWTPGRRAFEAVGLNERLRFYRYAPGQYFRWHRDGSFQRQTGERSLFTAMVYLNDDFGGGATEFDVADEKLAIVPARGMVLLFEHLLRHQGAPVLRGSKYVLRSDVMFRAAA